MGLVERDTYFLNEKTRLICHSGTHGAAYHAVHEFPWKGGLKHYPPSAIMTGAQLHMSELQHKFGSYCQVAEDVTPCNSLAAHARGAIPMKPSGNLPGGQCFLALWILARRLIGIAGKNFLCLWLLSIMSMCLVMLNVL